MFFEIARKRSTIRAIEQHLDKHHKLEIQKLITRLITILETKREPKIILHAASKLSNLVSKIKLLDGRNIVSLLMKNSLFIDPEHPLEGMIYLANFIRFMDAYQKNNLFDVVCKSSILFSQEMHQSSQDSTSAPYKVLFKKLIPHCRPSLVELHQETSLVLLCRINFDTPNINLQNTEIKFKRVIDFLLMLQENTTPDQARKIAIAARTKFDSLKCNPQTKEFGPACDVIKLFETSEFFEAAMEGVDRDIFAKKIANLGVEDRQRLGNNRVASILQQLQENHPDEQSPTLKR